MQNKIIDVFLPPDEEKIKHMQVIIDSFERAYPGLIKKAVRKERRDEFYQVGGKKNADPYLRKGTKIGLRKIMVMPEELGNALITYDAALFRSKDGFHWFVKQFPQFQVPDKVDF